MWRGVKQRIMLRLNAMENNSGLELSGKPEYKQYSDNDEKQLVKTGVEVRRGRQYSGEGSLWWSEENMAG